MIELCNLCPNKCNKSRIDLDIGICGETNNMRIAKYYLHPFEEPVISGKNGSGTIFFCGCSLKCVYCQNYELSRSTRGKEISIDDLVDIFKELEDRGAHNINLVTPTHFSKQVMKALDKYRPNIPILYNTHSYENKELIYNLLDYIDIFLPDLKFCNPLISKRYTKKENYFRIAEENIRIMMENKKTEIKDGLMKEGVIVRHLILPLCQQDSVSIVRWFKENEKNGAYLSIMSQYTPFGEIDNFPELKRRITKKEYDHVINEVLDLQIENCFIQDRKSSDVKFIPSWDY